MVNPIRFAAERLVHYRHVAAEDAHVNAATAQQATSLLSAAIQDRFGREPVLMTRLHPEFHPDYNDDWLLLTGGSVNQFLDDVGGVPESEANSDGMWHLVRGVAKKARQLPVLNVDLVPWVPINNVKDWPKGSRGNVFQKRAKEGSPLPRFTRPKDDTSQGGIGLYNVNQVLSELRRTL